ncbi:MAG: hypothetical protein LBR68_06765, partial [Lachnoclostridium sp.]|nr:hypothetical protein [Lachnoclostridium sp.]
MKKKILGYALGIIFVFLCFLMIPSTYTQAKGNRKEKRVIAASQVKVIETSQKSSKNSEIDETIPEEPIDTSTWYIGESDQPDAVITGYIGEEINLKLYGVDEETAKEITQTWQSVDIQTAAVDEEGKVQC